jgi:hypothetical protein
MLKFYIHQHIYASATTDRVQKAVIMSLIATSAIAWIAYIDQSDMMVAMTSYNPLSISLFTASWMGGMAAMMFPALLPWS